MTAPRFDARMGIYTFNWDEPTFIRMHVDHVNAESRSGEVGAEIRVVSTAPGIEGHLHQGRFTLTGTQSRATVAKHLGTRTPGRDIDWGGLIEYVSVKVLEAFRTGEPAILLRDAQEPEDDGHLLDPIVLGRHPTMWFGDGGSTKSLLALAAGLSIHADTNLLGIQPGATRVVALFDWEMDGWEHRKRMVGLLGEQLPDFIYVPCRGAIWDELDRLRKIIAQHGIQYGIFDSVGMAAGGLPLTSDEAANRYYSAVRQLGIGSLNIAHKVKAEDGDKFPFGSQFWHNGARATFFVKRESESETNVVNVALHHRKANTTSQAAPIAFEVTFGGRIGIRRKDLRDVPAFDEDRTLRERIYDVLRAGAQTVAAIADELDAKPDSVSKTVRRFDKTFVRTARQDGAVVVGLRASHE